MAVDLGCGSPKPPAVNRWLQCRPALSSQPAKLSRLSADDLIRPATLGFQHYMTPKKARVKGTIDFLEAHGIPHFMKKSLPRTIRL